MIRHNLEDKVLEGESMGCLQINRHLQYTKLEDNSYEVVDILSGDVWLANVFIVRLLKCLDIHYIPSKIKFNKRIVVGHYPTLFLPEHEQASIYYNERYIDIDTGNERRYNGGKLACLRLNDGKEYYV